VKKNSRQNLLTMKIKYSTNEAGLEYISYMRENFNKVLRFTYNRIVDNPKFSTKELTAFQSELNHVEGCKSHLKNSAIYKSKEIYNKNKNNPQSVIFGGRKNFINRCKLKISKK